MGSIERQLKQDARTIFATFAYGLPIIFAGLLGIFLVIWPIFLIDGEAFGPHPNWWQWTLGAVAQLLWLPIPVLLGVVIWDTKRKPSGRRPKPRKAAPPANRERGAANRGAATVTYREAYAQLIAEISQGLKEAPSPQAVTDVLTKAESDIRSAATSVPEFYPSEFYHQLRTALVALVDGEAKRCQDVIELAQAQSGPGSAVLASYLSDARRSGDPDAEHRVWEQVERHNANAQAAARRLEVLKSWPPAINRMAENLGDITVSPRNGESPPRAAPAAGEDTQNTGPSARKPAPIRSARRR